MRKRRWLCSCVKANYADVFGPVLWVNNLPKHEFYHVCLKDFEVQLDSCSYPSPHEYREGS
jgi:hypothetical protein